MKPSRRNERNEDARVARRLPKPPPMSKYAAKVKRQGSDQKQRKDQS